MFLYMISQIANPYNFFKKMLSEMPLYFPEFMPCNRVNIRNERNNEFSHLKFQ